MARERGVFNFSGNLEVKKEAALDARLYVPTFAELTQASTWQDDDGNVWLYNTMVVGVGSGASAALYMLTDKTKYTQASAWVKLTTGGDLPEPESDVYMIGDLSEIDADSASSITAAQIQEMLGTPAQVTEAMTAGKLFVGKYGGVNMLFQPMATASNVQIVGQAFTDVLSFTFRRDTAGTAWQDGVMYSYKEAATKDEVQAIDNVYILPGSLYSLSQGSTDEEIKEAIGDFDKLAEAVMYGKIIAARISCTEASQILKAYFVNGQNLLYLSYGLFDYAGTTSLITMTIHKVNSTLSIETYNESQPYVLSSEYATKIETVDGQIEFLQNRKANSSDVYTKLQTDAKIDEKIGQKVAGVYTAKGSYPNLSDALGLSVVQNGWVFSIESEFELNGKAYPAGTNIAYIGGTANQASVETNWDALGGSFNMGEIEQSISEGDTSTLNSAKTYTDTQDADFLEQAKTYAQSLFQWHDVGE